MWIILDFLVISVIVLCIFFGIRRGFVRSAAELAGFILAIYLSFFLSGVIADYIYDASIKPSIENKVYSSIDNTAESSVAEAVNTTWENLPDYIINMANKIGISADSIIKTANDNIKNNTSTKEIVSGVADAVVRPIVVPLVKTITGTLIFVILMFLARFLAKIIGRAFRLPILGTINRTLGGLFGLANGVLVAAVICIFISVLAGLLPKGLWIFTKENIQNSYLFSFLASFGPFNK